jgi:hypothetical protein
MAYNPHQDSQFEKNPWETFGQFPASIVETKTKKADGSIAQRIVETDTSGDKKTTEFKKAPGNPNEDTGGNMAKRVEYPAEYQESVIDNPFGPLFPPPAEEVIAMQQREKVQAAAVAATKERAEARNNPFGPLNPALAAEELMNEEATIQQERAKRDNSPGAEFTSVSSQWEAAEKAAASRYNAQEAMSAIVGDEVVTANPHFFSEDIREEEAEELRKNEGALSTVAQLEKELSEMGNDPERKNQKYMDWLKEIQYIKPYKEELWSALMSAGASVFMGLTPQAAIASSFGNAQIDKEAREAAKKEEDKAMQERNDDMLKSLTENSQYMTATTFSSLLNQYGVNGQERNYYNAIFDSQKAELLSDEAAAYGTAEISTANNALWDDIKGYGEKDRTGSHGKYFQMLAAVATDDYYKDMGFDIREEGWSYVISNAMTDFWKHQDEWEESGAKASDAKIQLPLVFLNNALGLFDSESESMIPIPKQDPVLFAAIGQSKMILNIQYQDRNDRKDVEMEIHREWVTKFMGRSGKYGDNYPLYFKDAIMTDLAKFATKAKVN